MDKCCQSTLRAYGKKRTRSPRKSRPQSWISPGSPSLRRATMTGSEPTSCLACKRTLPGNLLLALVCAILPVSAHAEAQAHPASSPSRPNIIFILMDDLRWDEVDYPFVKVPNIHRIAREGVTFKNAFVTTPLCSPSRASYLTGQ